MEARKRQNLYSLTLLREVQNSSSYRTGFTGILALYVSLPATAQRILQESGPAQEASISRVHTSFLSLASSLDLLCGPSEYTDAAQVELRHTLGLVESLFLPLTVPQTSVAFWGTVAESFQKVISLFTLALIVKYSH